MKYNFSLTRKDPISGGSKPVEAKLARAEACPG